MFSGQGDSDVHPVKKRLGGLVLWPLHFPSHVWGRMAGDVLTPKEPSVCSTYTKNLG